MERGGGIERWRDGVKEELYLEGGMDYKGAEGLREWYKRLSGNGSTLKIENR